MGSEETMAPSSMYPEEKLKTRVQQLRFELDLAHNSIHNLGSADGGAMIDCPGPNVCRYAKALETPDDAAPEVLPGHPEWLYTTRRYPCGCKAEGFGDVPAYCSEHGAPPVPSPDPVIAVESEVQDDSRLIFPKRPESNIVLGFADVNGSYMCMTRDDYVALCEKANQVAAYIPPSDSYAGLGPSSLDASTLVVDPENIAAAQILIDALNNPANETESTKIAHDIAEAAGADNPDAYQQFARDLANYKPPTDDFVEPLERPVTKVAVLGASYAKPIPEGSGVCNMCGAHHSPENPFTPGARVNLVQICPTCSTEICQQCQPNHELGCKQMAAKKARKLGPTVRPV